MLFHRKKKFVLSVCLEMNKKNFFICLCICVLSGCDATNSENGSDIQSATPDIKLIMNEVASKMGTSLDAMNKEQNEIQNKYYVLCANISNQQYPDLLPNEHTKMCVCFAEKMSDFLYSSNKQEFDRYQAFDTYKIKIWNRELETCYKTIKS